MRYTNFDAMMLRMFDYQNAIESGVPEMPMCELCPTRCEDCILQYQAPVIGDVPCNTETRLNMQITEEGFLYNSPSYDMDALKARYYELVEYLKGIE